MNFFADILTRARTSSVPVCGGSWPTIRGRSRARRSDARDPPGAFMQSVVYTANGCEIMDDSPSKSDGRPPSRRRARPKSCSRTVTLQMLLDANILEPGGSVLSLEYMVTKMLFIYFAGHVAIRLYFVR